jgi:hypothetical protein
MTTDVRLGSKTDLLPTSCCANEHVRADMLQRL